MQEWEDTGSSGRGRASRWWPQGVVAGVVGVVVGVLVPFGGAVSPAGGAVVSQPVAFAGQGAPCAAPGVAVTAPVPAAVLRPGRVVVTGRADVPGTSVQWTTSRPDGSPVGTGVVVADTGDGTYAVPLDLPQGEWTVTVRALPDPPADCTWTAVSFSVSETVEGTSWTSGASGTGVSSGEFGVWRGSPASVAGTWADDNTSQVELWTLQPGAELGAWDGALDVAVGAIGDGETWADAAAGAYDERWAASLQEMARLREGRAGTTYVRFAHEMNGNWYSWSVTPESTADFITAWQRYRALQQQYFPAARLVFAPNDDSAGDVDWRTMFPGSQHVDVVSMSFFNHDVDSAEVDGFWERALSRDSTGAPAGIQGFADFARGVGLPFAVSEWGPHAAFGDGRTYTEQMYQWFRANAGTGPGQLLYEVLFNVERDGNPFSVFPATNVPAAAEAYRRLW